MVILSLFDGISCGRVALERAKIKVDQYFASEIDKYAEAISKYNYPDIIRLGDVRNIETENLPKIDVLIGGSPCQSFSFAGKRKGMVTKCEIEITSLDQYLELKQQSFEFEGQSYLFWEYIRIWKECKPRYFFLENVDMDSKWDALITRTLGIAPIKINSELVSAQSRKRYYWTNIGAEEYGFFADLVCTIPQPEDRGILIKDIAQAEVPEKYYLSDRAIRGFLAHKERHDEKGTGFGFKPKTEDDKANTLRANMFKKCPTDTYIVDWEYKNRDPHLYTTKSPTLRCGTVFNVVEEKRSCLFNLYDEDKNPDAGRVYSMNGKSVTLKAVGGGGGAKTGLYLEDDLFIVDTRYPNEVRFYKDKSPTIVATDYKEMKSVFDGIKIRRLTPLECERLQTMPDEYTKYGIDHKGNQIEISDTQRYKTLGNGWTADVIAYILSFLPDKYKKEVV